MNIIHSTYINGTLATPLSERRARKFLSTPPEKELSYPVFCTTVDGKTHLCCWVRGAIENDETKMTPIGQATLEALMSIPSTSVDTILILQQLIDGPTPPRDKIVDTFRRLPVGARVCFVVEPRSQADSCMVDIFNIVGEIHVSHFQSPDIATSAHAPSHSDELALDPAEGIAGN